MARSLSAPRRREAIHVRQPEIDDETAGRRKLRLRQQLRSAAIGCNGEALEFQRKLQRAENGGVVVDDHDLRRPPGAPVMLIEIRL